MNRNMFFAGVMTLIGIGINYDSAMAQYESHHGAEISGTMADQISSKRLKDYTVEVRRNGDTEVETDRKRDAYSVFLEMGAVYTITFKAEGYWNKVMQIDLTGKDGCAGLYKMEIDGKMTPKQDGADFTELQNEPVAKASFSGECELGFDIAYSEENQKKWQLQRK